MPGRYPLHFPIAKNERGVRNNELNERIDTVRSLNEVAYELEQHEANRNPHGMMKWGGLWTQGQYYQHDVVRDGEWLSIANQDTTERPAPQTTGAPAYGLPDIPTWAESAFNGVVYSGHQYTFNQGGWITRVRAWAPHLTQDTEYRVGIVNSTDPENPIYTYITDPILSLDDWSVVWVNSYLVVAGQVLTVFLDVLNTGSESGFDGDWLTGAVDNNAAPAAQSWNRNTQHTTVRIQDVDLNSSDFGGNMINAVPGATIEIVSDTNPINFFTYRVLANPVDFTDHVEFSVELVDQGGTIATNDICSITFTIPVSQSTDYVHTDNYWNNNPLAYATTQGALQLNGVTQPGVENTAFGIDIEFTPGTISSHWTVLARSESLG